MKLYDLCVIEKNDFYEDIIGAFAIILEDCGIYYLVEIWMFKDNDGARVLGIAKDDLRPATEKEEKEFQEKWKKYIEDNE
ncbi:hypothetical protein [Riemerella columbipharyngis]|uniref:Uncharacterized protein n=1 Tax=Riemerella columbipharyngis TaxID=1071918 RepID=A0A1G7BPM6_9FLAO|nr:hypothetical protein [Riemerella columbipharyngis]SDE28907.1 hypothetical protein SAMN05421544_10671 [Riemerella columbipharyngis]